MGNIGPLSSFQTASTLRSGHVQSSLASDLQTRLQALIDSEAAAGRGVVDLNLAGSGEGHSFVAHLVTGSNAVPAGDQVACYSAASLPELTVASNATLASISPLRRMRGLLEDGSADGHRWMGIILHAP